MEGYIKMKVQTNSMIIIYQGYSTVTIHPLKMRRFIQDLGLAKRRATQLKSEEIQIDELFYQRKKLYTEINMTLKNECIACYDPAVQAHSYYLNKSWEKVDHNFENAFQLVDLWLANETAFEKTKDKIQVAVKNDGLYLTRSDLLRNLFFMDRLKATLMKLIL